MARTPAQLGADDLAFLRERHLGTLATTRDDGSPHVVAIAFTFEDGVVTMLSSDRTQKVRNADRGGRAAVCQVDGRRWLSLEGVVEVRRAADEVAAAVERHEARFRPVSENPNRVVVAITVDRILGSA